ncbi:MAG: putative transport system permease protein [Chloroflexota bacterium]|nr:putative transport system permease protein [Chloroflexota bacterium]
MNIGVHIWQLMNRERRRTLAAAAGVAIAAALMMSVVLFGSASGTTVTRRALADLPVDGQAILAPGADSAAATALLVADPTVRSTQPFDVVHFDGATLSKAGSATQTSSGVLVGVGPGFQDSTGLFSLSAGRIVPGQIVVSRDLATNLGLTPGDSARFLLAGGQSADLVVSGIVDITGADLILGPVDEAHRAIAANPPVNVAVTDLTTLAKLAGQIPAGAVASDPAAGANTGNSASPVLAPEPAVLHEILLRYDDAQLPGNPGDAKVWLDGVRRRIERVGAGTITIADDASASLEPVAADLAWGQVLFVFLALPGVALALALSRFAAESSAEATRGYASLLRARGASQRQLVSLFLGTTTLTAVLGAVIGAIVGTGLAFLVFGSELGAANPLVTILGGFALTVLLTTLLATLAAAQPLRDQLRAELVSGRQELGRLRPPLWQRLYLDLLALVAAGAVFWLVGGSGVHPVLNAEGNPTVTLALTSFVAPFLLWIGGTLFLLRLTVRLLSRGPLTPLLERLFGPGGDVAGRSLVSRAGAASRAIVLLALAVSFATSTLTFEATYRQQQRVDAGLTLGADLKAVPTTVVDASAAATVTGPGVTVASPFVDRVVYVGSEAQDLLAIDPTTLPHVATLSDSFFQGTTAVGAMGALASQPDAIFVSAETAKDYSIVPGDRIRIRIPDAHGQLREVDFHMAGVALEFPTAPKDAFLVANLDYVARQTGDPAISFVLAASSGDPSAASLGQRLGSGWTVSDLGSVTARLANSVTSVDLGALVTLDVGFAILIASVGVALFLLAGLSERKRELATLAAIGADPAQLGALVAAETTVVGTAGTAAGILTGGLVGVTLLGILAGVFDPPADVPNVPVAAVVAVILAVIVGLLLANVVATRTMRRIDVLAALRER